MPPDARILVVRLSAMGDVIHAMPAVAGLRKTYPKVHIGWAIEPAWVPLLTSGGETPLVDTVHTVPFRQWTRAPFSAANTRSLRMARRELQAAHYDVAVDMQGSVRSAWVARWAQTARLLGEDAPRETPARLFYRERIAHTASHIIEQDLELAAAVFGPPLPYAVPAFPRDAAAEQWAEKFVEQILTLHSASRVAVLLPGAGWGTKRWPAERYGAVAIGLREHGFHSLLNIGPGEDALAEAAVQHSAGTATAVATTLPQLIALLRRTALCVGGDTGPLHLASALQVPVVGIYGPTDPARNGPYSPPGEASRFRVLRNAASRRDHSRGHTPEAGLLTITAQDVLAAARDLLATIPADEVPR
jgi:heptosyltransferase-1